MKKYEETDGVWRTIRGRRIFIRKGESLATAMAKSGKFSRLEKRQAQENLRKEDFMTKTKNKKPIETQKLVDKKYKQEAKKGIDNWDNYKYNPEKQAEKNRLNENANIEGSGKTRLQRNWNKYSETDRREARHEIIQKKLADYKEKVEHQDDEEALKSWLRYRDTYQKSLDRATNPESKKRFMYERDMAQKEIDKIREYQAKKQSNNKNEYTRQELKDKYGTDDVDLINAGKEKENRVSLKEEKFIQNTNMYGGTREYNKEQLDKMKEAGIKPMKDSYTGGGWEGTKYDSKLSTKEIAKNITDYSKKEFPDVKLSRKTDYNGVDIYVMSSEKDLFKNDKDIDNLSDNEMTNLIRDSIGGYTRFDDWLEKNNKKSATGTYTINEKKEYLKKELNEYKNRNVTSTNGNEWYLSDYGKKVISGLNKEMNSYNYDDSDGMVDYFNTNFYGYIHIGKWDKKYQVNDVKAKVEAYKRKKGK